MVLDTAKVLFSAFTQEERPGPLKKGEREKDYEFDEFKGPILPAQQISYRRMFKFKKNKLKISMWNNITDYWLQRISLPKKK